MREKTYMRQAQRLIELKKNNGLTLEELIEVRKQADEFIQAARKNRRNLGPLVSKIPAAVFALRLS